MLIYNQMLVWHNNIKHTINLEHVCKMNGLECIHTNYTMQNTSFVCECGDIGLEKNHHEK